MRLVVKFFKYNTQATNNTINGTNRIKYQNLGFPFFNFIAEKHFIDCKE
jgi:hypothetical protein